jgi:hypothetical protein
MNSERQMEKSMDRPRESPQRLSQREDPLDEASDFAIEKFIADLDVNFMTNPISDQINIQHLIFHAFSFDLAIGPRKWFSNISVLFASLNLHGKVTQDDVFGLSQSMRWLAGTVHRLLLSLPLKK